MWLQRNKRNFGTLFVGVLLGCVATTTTAFANTNIQTKVCLAFEGPMITSPAADLDTEEASVQITGTGEPGMAVSVVRDDDIIGTTTVLLDGSYGIDVGLKEGDNVLITREINDCNTVKDSEAVNVHRTVVEPPQQEVPNDTQTESPQIVDNQNKMQQASRVHPIMGLPIEPYFETAGFLKPTITSPRSGSVLHDRYVWVKGQAQPKSVVTVYLNNRSVAYVIASDKGQYGALIGLDVGDNRIQVKATLGDSVAVSGILEVIYKPSEENLTPPRTPSEIITTVVSLIAGAAAISGVATGSVIGLRSLIRSRWRK